MVAHLADTPFGHLPDDADSLTVQTLITGATNDANVAYLAVGTHNETAQHTALYALFISLIGIFPSFIDKVDETSLASL